MSAFTAQRLAPKMPGRLRRQRPTASGTDRNLRGQMDPRIADSKIKQLERDVADLKRRVDDLTRLLKRASDDAVQRAARRAA